MCSSDLMMGKVSGYREERPVLVKTTAKAEGWMLRGTVPGFQPISCYKRPAASALSIASGNIGLGAVSAVNADEPMQWIFSDGLASVSLFVEPFDRQRHDKETSAVMGATQSISKQLGSYWLTVMGEVPLQTLRLFAIGLERKK